MKVKLIDITGKPITGEWGKEDERGTGIPVLRTTNFTNNGVINYNDVVTRIINKKNLSTKYLQNGDIIIEKSGGSEKQPVGRVVYFDSEENTYLFNNFTGVLRIINKKEWNSKYLFYVLFWNYLKGGTIKYQNKTTGLHNLQMEHFINQFEVYNRKIEEQQKIATVLDKVSELITLRKKQLEKLDKLVKSRFVEMFGDPVRNSKNLPIKKLINLGSLDRGRSKHRPRNAPELLGGKYPLIQTGEVTNSDLYITSYQNTYSELGLKQSKIWNAETLCITIAANIAQTAILSFDACFPDSIVGFVSYGQVEAVYMHYWFDFFQKILESQAPQVAQKNINLKILSNLNVIVPNIEQQQKFLIFVNKIEEQKLTIQQSLDKLEVLKKALMQEYFG